MNTAISKKKYAKLLAENLPRVISSDEDYTRMMDTVKELMIRRLSLSPEESELMRLMVRLIADYEEDRFTIHKEPVAPLDMLEHTMDAHNHTAKDIWHVIGDKGTTSKILNGERSISKAQAKRLAEFYHVSPALFI